MHFSAAKADALACGPGRRELFSKCGVAVWLLFEGADAQVESGSATPLLDSLLLLASLTHSFRDSSIDALVAVVLDRD
eukprot:2240905-Rhodomonas_salina.1